MKQWIVKDIVPLLLEAGRIAMDYIDNPGTAIKEDRTPVTAADKAVENFLTARLEDEASGIRLIGEETSSSKSETYLRDALRGSSWIVDPIDGTVLFANKIPMWGTSVAFSQGGKLREGAVYVPSTGEMLLSDSGTVLYARDAASGTGASSAGASAPEGFVSEASEKFLRLLKPLARPELRFDDSSIINLSQRLVRQGGMGIRCANTVHSLCSSVYSGILLATGRHGASVMGAKLWDIAGCLPALKNLGFYMCMPDGTDVLSLEISPSIYDLDFSSKRAFALHELTVCAPTRQIAEQVSAFCGLGKGK